jgi:hypothetical protein
MKLLRHLTTLALFAASLTTAVTAATPKTTVSIEGDRFFINGKPTYEGRTWKGKKIEGLMMNSRMVQGVFDDLNPATVSHWAYPDTGKWDAERNVREFLAAMPAWRAHGLLSFTINFQGGSPEGYSKGQPWINNAFRADGTLLPEYLARMKRVIEFADDLGMGSCSVTFTSGKIGTSPTRPPSSAGWSMPPAGCSTTAGRTCSSRSTTNVISNIATIRFCSPPASTS